MVSWFAWLMIGPSSTRDARRACGGGRPAPRALERRGLLGAQVAAADELVGAGVEPVQLQGHVGAALLDLLGEGAVTGQAQPVGDEDRAGDLRRAGDGDELEDLGM